MNTPPTLSVRVLFFAAARERAGATEAAHTLPGGAALADLRSTLLSAHPALEPLMRHVRWARNERFVSDFSVLLADGDVVALIPPVAGGNDVPLVRIGPEPLDARLVESLVAGPDRGGVVTFTGTVRDHTGPHGVLRLEYEAYASMAERVMTEIVEEAAARWPGVRVAVHHRVGTLGVGEAAVVIAASASHRAEAFDACRFTIERLKADVPIFKREVRSDGSVWVGLGP